MPPVRAYSRSQLREGHSWLDALTTPGGTPTGLPSDAETIATINSLVREALQNRNFRLASQLQELRQRPGMLATVRRELARLKNPEPGTMRKAGAGGKHSPKGGVTIGGKEFPGGEFIPGNVMATATKDEKAKIEGKNDSDSDEIQDDDVRDVTVDHSSIAQFSTRDGEEYRVYLEKGTYTFNGEDYPCWRFGTSHHDDGHWNTVREFAIREGKAYAEKMHEEPYTGPISHHAVEQTGRDRRYETGIATWNFYDDEGRLFEQSIRLEHGRFTPPGGRREEIDVYRYVSSQDGDDTNLGDWTTDEDVAREQGEEYARDEDMAKPTRAAADDDEDESEDDSETEGDGKVSIGPGAKKLWDELDIGHDLDHAHSLLGVPDDANIKISVSKGRIYMEVTHSTFESDMDRYFGKDANGKLYCYNALFTLKAKYRGDGKGLDIFSDQVDACREAGVDYITCNAAKGNGYIGFKVWPKFGYDQPVSKFSPSFQAKIEEHFPQARSVLDIMDTPGGKKWWETHGESMTSAVFNLADGSRSMTVLNAYRKAKGKPARRSLGAI